MLGHTFLASWKDKFDVKVTLKEKSSKYENYELFDETNSFYNVDLLAIERVIEIISSFQPDYLVNCTGITKQLSDKYNIQNILLINSVFPHKLTEICQRYDVKLIQLSTDCIFSGKDGDYRESDIPDAEDLYGRSKYLGEVSERNVLTLRKSSIGLELTNKHGLVEWFLNQSGSVKGYKKAIYSGFSTSYLAYLIEEIMVKHSSLSGLYHIASEPLSKYDLLTRLEERLENFSIDIIEDDKIIIDRSLNSTKLVEQTGLSIPNWNVMLDDLAEEINNRQNDSSR